MSTILITGASGFIGRALLPVLAPRHTLILAERKPVPRSIPAIVQRVVGEIGPMTDWAAALRGADAVVHLAGHAHVTDDREDPDAFMRVNCAGTRRLAEAARDAGIRRLVFLSSIKVMGETSGARPFREDDPPRPMGAYAQSKWAAEQELARLAEDGAMEVIILRPPLVYGPAVKANFHSLLRLCRLGLPLPFGAIDNRRSLIFSGNLADAIAQVVEAPWRAGLRTYLVSDGVDLSTTELVRRLTTALGRRSRLVPVPSSALRLALRLLGRGAAAERLIGSLAVDARRFHSDYAWRPPYTVEEGLAETARWFRAACAPDGEGLPKAAGDCA